MANDEQQKQGEKGDQDLNITFALGEVKGQLSVFRDQFADFKTDLQKTISDSSAANGAAIKDLDRRLKIVEEWHTKVTVLAAVAGTIGGWAMQWIIRHVG